MQIVVDLNRCQGYAQCVFLAPRVFELHGEEALMYAPAVPGEQHEHVRRAAAACPVQAILVGEPAGDGAAPSGAGGPADAGPSSGAGGGRAGVDGR
ncbi:ferredoxin [Streptomyces sp. SID7805]|uniref:ferredoxin n=1 Tax=Streptomyces sp. SID7805 TaxID=2690328 RepID=UPI000699D52F|nr:ferredoxin [Streptomyces sp. SID7805]MYU56377.1 ferredoxin [Streptomyces sp. SID7805]